MKNLKNNLLSIEQLDDFRCEIQTEGETLKMVSKNLVVIKA